MRGLDLSHWNGVMGCNILRDSNVELDFVIAKHSEGETVRDTMFDRYYSLAHDRCIIFEPYHFYVGNNFTSDRREILVGKLFEMEKFSTSGVVWIDWERELDKGNFEFILRCIEDYENTGGKCIVGLYASYSVFISKAYTPKKGSADMSLAEFCYNNEMPIWCARYKYRDYSPAIEYGINAIRYECTQPMIGNIPVDVNQISSKCIYKGNTINLDYDVRFMPAKV